MAATHHREPPIDYRGHYFAYNGNANVGGDGAIHGDGGQRFVERRGNLDGEQQQRYSRHSRRDRQIHRAKRDQGDTASVIATSKTDTTKSASATVTVNAAAAAAVTISPQTAFVAAGQVEQFMATVTGESATTVTWSVNGTAGGNATVGTIDANGNYTAPALTQNGTAMITATSTADTTKSASASVGIIANGVVTATQNVQVASYTINPPATANVSIQFGPDTTYGLNTWQQPTAAGGGPVTILVAGMKMNTAYHMRANITFADGAQFNDIDHTFTTGTVPAANLPGITITTPQPAPSLKRGVELMDLLGVGGAEHERGRHRSRRQRDLDIQPTPVPAGRWFQPAEDAAERTFPRGHQRAARRHQLFACRVRSGGKRDLDIHRRPAANALSTRKLRGMPRAHITGMHHDFALLPNGHIIVIVGNESMRPD